MIEILGYTSALLVSLSGLPFALRVIRENRTDLSRSGILMVVLGSGGMLLYELLTACRIPSILNFSICLTSWLIILYIKLKQQAIGGAY